MAKKIKKWEPENFELEMTTHWSFPNRGNWATHDAKWRGNWSPYIPRNLLLRYSQEGDLVLDQFAGGGTTLVEAKLLNRDIIGVDVNDVALDRCKDKIDFEHEGANGKVYIHKGDARDLHFILDESIDFVCAHPPYANLNQYKKRANSPSFFAFYVLFMKIYADTICLATSLIIKCIVDLFELKFNSSVYFFCVIFIIYFKNF